MRMIYPYEAILSLWLGIYDDDISVGTSDCDDLQFIRKEESPGAMSRKRHEPNLECRSFPGFHYILVGELESMLVFVILWCYYERMANHVFVIFMVLLWKNGQPWSNFGLEFRPGRSATQEGCDLVLLSGFTYKGMTSLTTYMMSWIMRFEETLNYFENESRSVLIGFGKCENIWSERFCGKNGKLTQQFFPRSKRILNGIYSLRDASIVISAVFAPFLRLCAAR